MNELAIICPVFNEEKNLILFHNKLLKILKKRRNYKIVYVNDGSKDNSLKQLKIFKKKNKSTEIISFTKNFGHQNAIHAGLKKIKAKKYLVMDSDGQHDPSLITKMLNEYDKKNVEIIQMVKRYGKYEGYFKRVISKLFYKFFTFLTGINIFPGSSDFYLISKKVRDLTLISLFSKNFLRGFIHWSGFKKQYIFYEPKKRLHGHSSYNFARQIDLALSGFFNFQNKFFINIFLISIFLLLCCLIYTVAITIDYYLNDNLVEGWSTIVILQLFFGSILIFLNSFMVYAISRILNLIANKPDYIIEE